jgi:hypothetical protein
MAERKRMTAEQVVVAYLLDGTYSALRRFYSTSWGSLVRASTAHPERPR